MKKELIVCKDPKSPISEIFRTLRTNIQFMSTSKEAKVILITSTFPGEGKSWVSSNLAATFAQNGKRIILIDSDMRKGRQYSIFGVSPTPGLSNCLSEVGEEKEGKKVTYLTGVEGVTVISAGNIPPNPSELLNSTRMLGLLDKIKEAYDLIIIDGTPCQLVADSLILTRAADSTIVVTAHKATKKKDLQRVITGITNVGGKIFGVVLNKIPVDAKRYEQSYYYGSTAKKKRKNKKKSFDHDENSWTEEVNLEESNFNYVEGNLK